MANPTPAVAASATREPPPRDAPPEAPLRVRAYRPSDRAAVRDICFQTGFSGEPVDFMYRDAWSWNDLFTRYFTDSEPDHALVACDATDRVVGYLLGVRDVRRMWGSYLRFVVLHLLLRLVWLRPGSARFWWRLLRDQLFDRQKPPALDAKRYPAAFHIDLLPEARGTGIAAVLLTTWQQRLRQARVPGCHCEVLAHNQRMQRFLHKFDYASLGRTYPVPGMRDADNRRLQGQRMACELD